MTDNVLVPPGKYIVAVSGGVDSVVLLDILSHDKNLDLVVAHFDHGIREDSAADAEFVESLAQHYGLPFELETTQLGKDASELEARNRRYDFLRRIFKKYQASAIITAHHQDDVIETSMINIIRGTGRHGLTSLKSHPDIVRPLLSLPKQTVLEYAKAHNLSWREDSTNADKKYLRNKLRLDVVAVMTPEQKRQWLALLEQASVNNEKLDTELQHLLRRGQHKDQLVINRQWFIKLPHTISKEVIHILLNKAGAKEIDKKTIERLVVQIKTIPHGKTLQVAGVDVQLTKRSARFKSR